MQQNYQTSTFSRHNVGEIGLLLHVGASKSFQKTLVFLVHDKSLESLLAKFNRLKIIDLDKG